MSNNTDLFMDQFHRVCPWVLESSKKDAHKNTNNFSCGNCYWGEIKEAFKVYKSTHLFGLVSERNVAYEQIFQVTEPCLFKCNTAIIDGNPLKIH